MSTSRERVGAVYSTSAILGAFGVGGPGTYLVRALARKRSPVRVIARGLAGPLPPGTTVDVVSRPAWFRWIRRTRLGRYIHRSPRTERLELDREAARRAPDCDVAVLENSTALETMKALKARGARIVLKYNNQPFARFKAEMDEEIRRWGGPPFFMDDELVERTREECRLADLVHAVSASAARALAEDGVPAAKIRSSCYGVDAERFRPATGPKAGFVVAFVGWLQLYKGFPYLVEGFRDAAIPGSELLLHGGTDIRHYHDLVERLRGAASVRVVRGPVEETYAKASVVVLPSVTEGFPNVLFETMASGIPIILSNLAGVPEVVREGVDGFVVPAREPDAIRDRLLRLHQDPALRLRMGAAAREAALARPWSKFEADVEAILDEALRGTTRTS